jgi:uncharacterized protein (DUF488 family)
MMQKTLLFTTGYEGFDQETFLWKLRLDGVEAIVDVRDNPVSRNRVFSQSSLKMFLNDNGIEYVHLQELGVPSHFRRALRLTDDLVEYFAAYRQHLSEVQGALDELTQVVFRRRCCLLCVERDPLECHRSVLAEVFARQHTDAVEVRHI